jgi:hypothetical protein
MMDAFMIDSDTSIDRWGTEMATLGLLDKFYHSYGVCSVTT